MTRVLIVDDHPIFRRGLAMSLAETGDILVCGEADSAAAALERARALRPDVVLLDLSLPGGGFSVLADLRAIEGVRVAILTASEEGEDVRRAFAEGASGYVLKGIGARALADAIRAVAAGEGHVAPALAARVLTEICTAEGHARPGPSPMRDPAGEARARLLDQLTPREAEVLRLVAEGCSNKEVGRRADIQEKTVKHHMTRILHKLNARNRTEAAMVLRGEDAPV